jgi:signal transduction histidine kinase/CheY-like chemotaxis protein/ABC-type amino acid transport substrate-binding protein
MKVGFFSQSGRRKAAAGAAVVICAALLLLGMASAVRDSASGIVNDEGVYEYAYKSLHDIPGITDNDIDQINAIRGKYDTLIFANLLSTELFINENGEFDGFVPKFISWFSKLFDIPIKVQIEEWDDLVEKLQKGKVHFTGELTSTEERKNTHFMTRPIIERTLHTMRMKNAPPIEEILGRRTLRYAFLDGSITGEQVAEHVNYKFEKVYVDDYGEALKKLRNGKIDAFIEESTAEINFSIFEDLTSTHFFPLIFSPVSLATQTIDLKPVINVMDKALKSGAIRYVTYLYNRGYLNYKKFQLHAWLTDEEKMFIAQNDTVYFVAEHANYPISFYDHQEKKYRGIAIDLLKNIEYLTGLRFEINNPPKMDFPDLFRMLERGYASMITELIRDEVREGKFLWSEVPFFQSGYALISDVKLPNINVNELSYYRVGLVDGAAHKRTFLSWFPNHRDTVTFSNTVAALDALVKGEVDLVMSSQHQLLILTNYRELPNYKINFSFNLEFGAAFGFNMHEATLRSIVDKSLRLIEVQAISNEWLRKTYDYRLKMLQHQIPFYTGGVLLLLIIIASLFFLHKKTKESKSLEKQIADRTAELERQNALAHIINETAMLLLETDPHDYMAAIEACIGMLGKHFDVERVCLWKNNVQDGKLYYERISCWINEEIVIDHQLTSLSLYPSGSVPGMEKAFGEGRYFINTRDKFTPDELAHFPPSVQTFAACPMSLEGAPWGFIALYDCKGPRDFSVTEWNSLYSWGLLSTNAMERNATVSTLEKALEAAEAASHTKSAFLANMSHEIRTPMNGIIGFSELAMDDDNILPVTRDYLEKISRSAKALLEIINNILDLSKIEAGKLELETIPFLLHDVLEQCHTIVTPKALEKNITLYFYSEPMVNKRLIGDPTQLRQVLINLLSNSVKFTNVGTVKLSATVEKMTENTCTICFKIRDSGIGMSPEKIKEIFEPFTQADNSTTRRYGGTGLGLSISKSIVEAMGSRIEVESMPSVGSVFSFEIVFNTTSAPDEISRSAVEKIAKKPLFSNQEILICEDNDMNQMVIIGHLSKIGLRAIIAENGKVGVDIVSKRKEQGKEPFPLIFMDMHMPVMDGLEASTLIRQIEPNTPIVAMTANIMSKDVTTYKEFGVDDYVGKPFTTQELWTCLMKYITPESVDSNSDGDDIMDSMQKQLRIDFVKSNRTKYREITDAIGANDIVLAHRLAHTLKGTAGLIGMTALQFAAANVEDALKNSENVTTQEQMGSLDKELNTVLTLLMPLFEEATAAPAKQADVLSPEATQELIQKLDPLLKSSSSKCLSLIDDIRGIPNSEKLIELMEDFNFKPAYEELAEIKKGLGL